MDGKLIKETDMSIWKKKTDERLSKVEQECKELIQEGRELQCQTHGGHKWRFVKRPWTINTGWGLVYKFRCYNCDAERLFTEAELSPDQRRELEYLGVLGKKTKKGGKK